MTRIITFAGLMLALALPGAALAQTAPTTDAYGGGGNVVQTVPPTGEVREETVSGGPDDIVPPSQPREVVETDDAPRAVPPSISTPIGNLPFTGLDIGLIAAGGLLLLGMGFGMRRVTRHQN